MDIATISGLAIHDCMNLVNRSFNMTKNLKTK